MPNRKNVRDLSKLSGIPLKETTISSHASFQIDGTNDWLTSADLKEEGLTFSEENFYETAVFLMANPNITSSHLFRADILFDSQGLLRTPEQDEELAGTGISAEQVGESAQTQVEAKPAPAVAGFDLIRTVVRRLIPRNQEIDKPLEQTCHFYRSIESIVAAENEAQSDTAQCQPRQRQRVLTMFLPHVESPEQVPFYHPLLKGLATLYDCEDLPNGGNSSGIMSVHFLPFTQDFPDRLERTLHTLLNFYVRLTRGGQQKPSPERSSQANSTKDNLVPRHLTQNTYARLKSLYAADLMQRWVESTEPSKHVYEDLAITAFLIELWRLMYGVEPINEGSQGSGMRAQFPGFVDMACGNGVLVYVLLMEGYSGCGFDARARKSWSIYPPWVQERLSEKILLPKPFADVMGHPDLGMEITTGDFARDTFIISNHADELTVWTPLIAALACPESPLPFLAIPCCSHALSGARYRYPQPKGSKPKASTGPSVSADTADNDQNPQSASGDLNALRAAKQAEKTEQGMWTSMYGLLTAKTMSVAEEAGYEVERTLLRIPSTRNIGIVGGRRAVTAKWRQHDTSGIVGNADVPGGRAGCASTVEQAIAETIDRECSREGGLGVAAQTWIERARGLRKDTGKSIHHDIPT
ncbi:tRNA (uracil-O(2)-)-methyltransferase [Penicillium diatomitis]|uniref:tRNA (uracil-O(2)-)-methyltransferase n=1 Tax=Penicillium diatomitis TaxID=2819901 RepID=A0A9X0BU43_9EURO|nr:tRNA (uracil-O(2)-)-methyltransferase [Penicillium diatomitis]KAJ5484784.1 tRNA (uracil-O(2)-)-methyltransferase [Penicillium diatomitis]